MAETNLEPERGSTSYKVTDKPKVRPAPIDVSAAQAMSISYDKTDKGKASTPKSKLGHRRVDEKGETTYKKTPSSALISAIQLGIGFTVGRLSAKQERDVLMQDFAEIETVWFPSEGTKGTPSHKFSDFKFKSYAPVAFRFFRDLFHMKPDDFMMSLCNDPLQELSNPGASGSLFFVTCDNQFIIKTVDHKEAEFLQKLLPGYYLNLNQNKKTLLPKFFGLFCYQCGGKNIRLVVMNNLLPTVYKFHWKYDLKGSTYKRRASKAERAKNTPTLKDLDFLTDHPEGMLLESDTHSALIKTLQRDCRVLESFKIMDFSLLLAIHNLDEAQRERQQDGALTPSGQMVSSATEQEKTLDKTDIEPENPVLQRSKSLKGREGFSSAWEAITVKETIERPYGGIPARNAKGERLLLFIGIIDILQSYRLKKKLEHGWKSMIHDGDTVSVHRPNFYSRRFLEFMSSKIFKKLPGKEKTSPRKRSLAASVSRQRSMTEADKSRIEQRNRERNQMGENTTPFRSYSRSFSERDRAGTLEAGATSLQPKRLSSENSKDASTESSSGNKELTTIHKDLPDSGVPPSPRNESVSKTTEENASPEQLTTEMTLTAPTHTNTNETSEQLESSVTNNHIDQESKTENPITPEKSSSVSNTDINQESKITSKSASGRTLWDRPWSPDDDKQRQYSIQVHTSEGQN